MLLEFAFKNHFVLPFTYFTFCSIINLCSFLFVPSIAHLYIILTWRNNEWKWEGYFSISKTYRDLIRARHVYTADQWSSYYLYTLLLLKTAIKCILLILYYHQKKYMGPAAVVYEQNVHCTLFWRRRTKNMCVESWRMNIQLNLWGLLWWKL